MGRRKPEEERGGRRGRIRIPHRAIFMGLTDLSIHPSVRPSLCPSIHPSQLQGSSAPQMWNGTPRSGERTRAPPAHPQPLTWLRRSGHDSSSAQPPASSGHRDGDGARPAPRHPPAPGHPHVPNFLRQFPPRGERTTKRKRGETGTVTSAPTTWPRGPCAPRGAGRRDTAVWDVTRVAEPRVGSASPPCPGVINATAPRVPPEAVGVPVGVQRLQVLPIEDALAAARTHGQVGPYGTGLSPRVLSRPHHVLLLPLRHRSHPPVLHRSMHRFPRVSNLGTRSPRSCSRRWGWG